MIYIDRLTGEWPLTLTDIRKKNINTSFPDDFAGNGTYAVVRFSQAPSFNRRESKLVEVRPDLVDGEYVQKWVVQPLDSLELQAALEELKNEFVTIAQEKLDSFAREKQYDDIKTLVTYVDDANPVFDSQARIGKEKRSQMWTSLTKIMEDVVSGAREVPNSFEDIENDLPPLVW